MDGKVEKFVEIHYRALHFDNYQGGSGMPIKDRIVKTIPSDMSVSKLFAIAHSALAEIENKPFFGETELIEITVFDIY
jgi:hypothetical protein